MLINRTHKKDQYMCANVLPSYISIRIEIRFKLNKTHLLTL